MITVTAYNAEKIHRQGISSVEELQKVLADWPTVWVQIKEPEKPNVLEMVAKTFNIHHLALEDVLTKQQRAKIEQYDDTFFIIIHELTMHKLLASKQICIFLGKNYVVTSQFDDPQSLQNVECRLDNNIASIRMHGADYLACSILDSVIDTYFPALECLGESLENLEIAILRNPSRDIIPDIHRTKRQLLAVRRTIWPVRELVNALLRDSSAKFSNEVQLHLRDCYDHAVELIDLTENYRDLGADLMDVYLSSISNRMNEVMKVLTIIATVFAPPTLIAAIYGMNFNPNKSPFNMPELNWYYGYPIILIAMLLTSIAVLAFMHWKGWLGVMTKRYSKSNGANIQSTTEGTPVK